MKLPFHHSKITGRFGTLSEYRRRNNMQPHSGLDFAMPEGTPIPAISKGTVVLNQFSKVLGHVLVLRVMGKDGEIYFIGYCHLQTPGVQAPTKVTEGQIIGRVGNSGSASTGAHLHMTVSKELKGVFGPTSVKQDPIEFIKANK
jgi:murein DD-endopeptidase MepM/ murein hydrolase activator NlpD